MFLSSFCPYADINFKLQLLHKRTFIFWVFPLHFIKTLLVTWLPHGVHNYHFWWNHTSIKQLHYDLIKHFTTQTFKFKLFGLLTQDRFKGVKPYKYSSLYLVKLISAMGVSIDIFISNIWKYHLHYGHVNIRNLYFLNINVKDVEWHLCVFRETA